MTTYTRESLAKKLMSYKKGRRANSAHILISLTDPNLFTIRPRTQSKIEGFENAGTFFGHGDWRFKSDEEQRIIDYCNKLKMPVVTDKGAWIFTNLG